MTNTELIIVALFTLVCFLLILSLVFTWKKWNKIALGKDLLSVRDAMDQMHQLYREENELMITNIQLLTSKDHSIYLERKNAILDFFTHLNEWVWDGLNISVGDYNHTNYHEITSRLVALRDNYNQTNISFGRLQLLVNDDALIKTGYDSIMDTLRLHHFVENTLKSYQKTLSWEKTLLDKITSRDYDFFKLSPDMKTFYERQSSENEIEKRRILDGYNDRHWELFKPVVEKLNDFRGQTKEIMNEMRLDSSTALANERWSSIRHEHV